VEVGRSRDQIAKDVLQVAVHDLMILPSPIELSQQLDTTDDLKRGLDVGNEIIQDNLPKN
jgi:hypothetical protein